MSTIQGLDSLHLIGTQVTAKLTMQIAEKISNKVGKEVCFEIVPYSEFTNGESHLALKESVRGKYVYVVSDVNAVLEEDGKIPTLNDRFVNSNLLLQTAKVHGAKTINIIYTFFPYGRQDKPVMVGLKERAEREPSSVQFVVDILEMLGVDYCITIDIHNPATLNAFKKTHFVSLYTGWFIWEVMQKINKKKIIISPTDQGGEKKMEAITRDLGINSLSVVKKRDYSKLGTIDSTRIYGNVKDNDILVYDDMIDTGGTLCSLLEQIRAKSPSSINVAVPHGMFNGKAIEKFIKLYKKGVIEKIYCLNTVYRGKFPQFIQYIDASNIFANTIIAIYKGDSINYNDNS